MIRSKYPKLVTVEELKDLDTYEDELKHFDWMFDYSDDYGVWSRGNAKKKVLEAAAKHSQEHEKLFNKYQGQ